MRAMRRAACPQAAADVCHSGKVRGSPPYIQTAKGAAAISRRGGFYIRPGWFSQTGAFVRPRAGHARPLQGCCDFLREAQKNPSVSKKVCSPLGPLCEGAPPAGGGGENCTITRNISGSGKVLSLRPFGAPPSQREVFRQSAIFFALRAKKSPTVRSRERWGQNAISRPLKRRRAKRQNGGAACYWQEPHRRGKQPVDGSRLVMVSRR